MVAYLNSKHARAIADVLRPTKETFSVISY